MTANTPRGWTLRIHRPRRVPGPELIALAMLLAAWNAGMVFVAFEQPRRWFWPAWWLEIQTGGLVNLTLSANLVNFLMFVVLLLMGLCRQMPRDVGLDPRRIMWGLAGTLAIYAAVLIIQWFSSSRSPAWNAAWSAEGWERAVGIWLAQLFGNALFEEIMYRGFFLGQAYLMVARWIGDRPAACLSAALVLSQGTFAAIHIPVNIVRHRPEILLLAQFAAGLLLAGLYLMTGNLFLVIGLHVLINDPPSPIEGPIPGGVAAGLLSVCLLAALILRRVWSSWRGRSGLKR